MKHNYFGLLLGCLIGLIGCEIENNPSNNQNNKKTDAFYQTGPDQQRWYKKDQVDRGSALFQINCASCHKADASGTDNWREADAKGNYPPPPLNGTAHTWHHPLSALRQTVRFGGVPLGGTMPGFADELTDEQIDDILAWVQSHWSDKIYALWYRRTMDK